jgi:protein-S-isoprenylcysteine O-methyltransferase Ste14
MPITRWESLDMPFHIHGDIRAIWIFLCVVWLIGALFGKPTVQKQSTKSRLIQTSLGIISALLIFGGNWSAAVTVKRGHTLVRRGPYAITRHPIYTGIVMGTFGTAMAFREVKGLLGLAIVLVTLRLKMRLEESFMKEQFGGEYENYQREVRALIPFVW